MFRRKNRKKGQSTLEYIIMFTGVIAILIVFLSPSGPFRSSLNKTFNQAINGMETMSSRLANSRP